MVCTPLIMLLFMASTFGWTLAQIFSDVDVLDLELSDTDLKGFGGGFHDGTFGYVVPFDNGQTFGKVARFGLQDFSSVEVLDLSSHDPDLKGFLGGFHDGTFGYVVPFDNGQLFGKVARFGLQDFSSVEVLDLSSHDPDLKGFGGGFHDDTFGYVLAHWVQGSGKVARFGLQDFSSVEVLDLSSHDPDLDGFVGGFHDCTFGYVVLGWFGKVARFGLQDFSSVEVLDLSSHDPDLKEFDGGFHDGTFGYVVPLYNGQKFGKVARFGLQDFSSVEVLDLSSRDPDLKAFGGGFHDGTFGYVVPNGEIGKVARFRTVVSPTTTSSSATTTTTATATTTTTSASTSTTTIASSSTTTVTTTTSSSATTTTMATATTTTTSATTSASSSTAIVTTTTSSSATTTTTATATTMTTSASTTTTTSASPSTATVRTTTSSSATTTTTIMPTTTTTSAGGGNGSNTTHAAGTTTAGTTTARSTSSAMGRVVKFTLVWEFRGGGADLVGNIDGRVLAEAAGAALNIPSSLITVEVKARSIAASTTAKAPSASTACTDASSMCASLASEADCAMFASVLGGGDHASMCCICGGGGTGSAASTTAAPVGACTDTAPDAAICSSLTSEADCASLTAAAGAGLNYAAMCCFCGGGSSGAARMLQSAPTTLELSFVVFAGDTLADLSDNELMTLIRSALSTLTGGLFLTELKLRVPFLFDELDSSTLGSLTPPSIVTGVSKWIVAAWSACDNACGMGSRSRAVMCSTDASLCPFPKPDVEDTCADESGCVGCPLGKDFPIDCESQAIVVLVLLLLGCCCCCSCCIWCFRKAVVRRQGGDGGKEVPLEAKFEIFDDPEKAYPVEPGSQKGGAAEDEWFALGNDSVVAPVEIEEPATDGVAGASAVAEQPRGRSGLDDREGGAATTVSTRHVAVLDAPAEDPPDAFLAYGQNARVEYFSSTWSCWVSGTVMKEDELATALNNTSGGNKNIKDAKHLPDYNIKLSNGQLRYDVRLDELRLELQIGERVEARVPPSTSWMQGVVRGKVFGNPAQYGYIIEVAGRNPLQTRASAVNVCRHFPVGDKVEAYLGIDRGWASGVVVADPPAMDLLASDGAAEKFSLTPEWHKMCGTGKNQAWTKVVVKLLPSGDGDTHADRVAVPMFLLRRVTEPESLAAAPEVPSNAGASSGATTLAGAASPSQSPHLFEVAIAAI